MRTGAAFSILIFATLAAISGGAAQATSTSAHAMIVSGVAEHPGGGSFDCATSGPQPKEQKFFGSASVGLPIEGYAYCNLAGGIDNVTNPNGISSAHQAVTHGFSNGVHDQKADAVADYGVLKVSSSGSYTGDAIGGFSYHDGQAAAYSTDTLPTPANGKFFQFDMTIDGSASVVRTSQILSLLAYQVNDGPIFSMFVTNILGNGGIASVSGMDGNSISAVPGFTVLPNSVSGSGTVISFRSEITSGSTFDLTLAMLAASYPSPFGGAADVDFSNTARMSGLRFFDASGAPIAFGSIIGASGRLYDADGVHTVDGAVPEPGTWALTIAGFALVGSAMRRSRRRIQRQPTAVLGDRSFR